MACLFIYLFSSTREILPIPFYTQIAVDPLPVIPVQPLATERRCYWWGVVHSPERLENQQMLALWGGGGG